MTLPTHIGPYRVERLIAHGGVAAVYEVAHPDSGLRFAAKVLARDAAGGVRFAREYRALARVDHPGVVRVHRYGHTDEGHAYLLLELLDGVAAQVRVKATGRPGDPARTAEAARIGRDVAEALAHLHGRGILHRDVKSSNVLVLRDGAVKLLDFGTARLLRGAESITLSGEFVGTWAYASPEQVRGDRVDARSDLYGLGVLLYRMLTGRRPFEADTPQGYGRLHLEEAPSSLRAVVPALPEALDALVLRMLAKAPDDRPAGAAEVAEALRRG